jgi:FkbM family methyltransferase
MEVRTHVRHLGALLTDRDVGRAAGARHFAFGLAKRAVSAVAVDDQGMRFYVETSDFAVGRDTFRYGTYELSTMRVALDLIRRRAGVTLAGRHFVDIGANIGTTTVPACRLFGASQAIAAEPASRAVRQLKINVIANDLDASVQVIQAAVSDKAGRLLLEVSDTNHGDNRVRVGPAQAGEWNEDARRTEEVDVLTLDDIATRVSDPAIVWVDTQGHEGHVLAGGGSMAQIPTVIEYWPYALRRAGGLDLLHSIIEDRYSSVVDVRASESTGTVVEVCRGSRGLKSLAATYPGPRDYTDLVLLPR